MKLSISVVEAGFKEAEILEGCFWEVPLTTIMGTELEKSQPVIQMFRPEACQGPGTRLNHRNRKPRENHPVIEPLFMRLPLIEGKQYP